MNREARSLLSEKVGNLFLTWRFYLTMGKFHWYQIEGLRWLWRVKMGIQGLTYVDHAVLSTWLGKQSWGWTPIQHALGLKLQPSTIPSLLHSLNITLQCDNLNGRVSSTFATHVLGKMTSRYNLCCWSRYLDTQTKINSIVMPSYWVIKC